MTGISANAYPLSLLEKLGIKVKGSDEADIALPTTLGDYLDRVIEGGDLNELNQLVPGINSAVVEIGKSNPVVLLNALLVSSDSSESFLRTGSETVDPSSTADFRHLSNLADYHSRAIETIADIAAEAGLHNHGMHFEVKDPEKFQALIDRLTEIEGFNLDERALELFNDIMVDMLDQPLDTEYKIPKPELNRRIKYMESLADIGFVELKNGYSGNSVSGSEVLDGYRNLLAKYDDDESYRVAVSQLETTLAPLHEIG